MPGNNSSIINLLIYRRVNFCETNYSFQSQRVLQTISKISLVPSQWNCFLSEFPENTELHVNDNEIYGYLLNLVPFGSSLQEVWIAIDHYLLHFQWSMFLRELSPFATLVRIFFEILSHYGVEFSKNSFSTFCLNNDYCLINFRN